MNRDLARYLERRRLRGPWRLAGTLPRVPRGAVVIPSLAEGDELFATLDSLDANAPQLRRDFAVVVVINRPLASSEGVARQNARDLEELRRRSRAAPTAPLAWVDASTGELALPERDAGVGSARKLGYDLLLAATSPSRPIVLASLDADTRVATTYLAALARHFGQHAGGCVLPFRHRPAADAAGQRAIDLYELYMRAYVAGLTLAGSPYAHHALGSALACRSDAYLRAGGMNRRKGGEDFYFLQQLVKTSQVMTLAGTLVEPSARVSQRAPFGTGRAVGQLLRGEEAVRFHAPQAFTLLGGWLRLVREGGHLDGERLLEGAGQLDPLLRRFLESLGFVATWRRLQRNASTPESCVRSFDVWFDGLRTLRLLRAAGARWPSSSDPRQVAALLGWTGDGGVEGMLARLRRLQGEG